MANNAKSTLYTKVRVASSGVSSSLHKYQMIILQGLFLFHEKSWVILRLMWYNAVCTVMMMMTVVSVVVCMDPFDFIF